MKEIYRKGDLFVFADSVRRVSGVVEYALGGAS